MGLALSWFLPRMRLKRRFGIIYLLSIGQTDRYASVQYAACLSWGCGTNVGRVAGMDNAGLRTHGGAVADGFVPWRTDVPGRKSSRSATQILAGSRRPLDARM
jgi:hypothetical protein